MNPHFHREPKAQLHVHLEGSVTRETLAAINPSLDPAEVAARFEYTDFLGFLKAYVWVSKQLTEPAHYRHAARELFETFEANHVTYAEVTLSAGVILWKGEDFAAVYAAVQDEAARARTRVRWIVDMVRQFPLEESWRVARLAAERVGNGVVAIGIGGDEVRGPAGQFADLYRWARDRGLHLHAHAGETTGPEGVWAALSIGAERIGHGIGAAGDERLLEHLRDRQIPLEICMTSNLRTGVVKEISDHPVRRLFDAGVPVVLDTDDPALFACSLPGEFDLARRAFGFSDGELDAIRQNAFRFGFDTL